MDLSEKRVLQNPMFIIISILRLGGILKAYTPFLIAGLWYLIYQISWYKTSHFQSHHISMIYPNHLPIFPSRRRRPGPISASAKHRHVFLEKQTAKKNDGKQIGKLVIFISQVFF